MTAAKQKQAAVRGEPRRGPLQRNIPGGDMKEEKGRRSELKKYSGLGVKGGETDFSGIQLGECYMKGAKSALMYKKQSILM